MQAASTQQLCTGTETSSQKTEQSESHGDYIPTLLFLQLFRAFQESPPFFPVRLWGHSAELQRRTWVVLYGSGDSKCLIGLPTEFPVRLGESRWDACDGTCDVRCLAPRSERGVRFGSTIRNEGMMFASSHLGIQPPSHPVLTPVNQIRKATSNSSTLQPRPPILGPSHR